MPRVIVALACSECHRRNYTTTKKKREGAPAAKLSLRRYCRWCRKHTLHNETKVE